MQAMTCEPCTYLREPVADSLPTLSLGINLSLPLSGMLTPAKSFESAPQKDGYTACTCTRETFGCSIHPTTPEAWIASMRASLARICQSLEIRQDSAMAQEAAFTEKCCESLAWFDRDTYSWRTSQQSFLEGWEPYSQTWPRAGMTVAGAAWKHLESERRIDGIDGGYSPQWPTPTVCGNHNRKGASATSWDGLATAVLKTPTPSANDWKGSSKAGQRRGQLTDPAMRVIDAGGKLSPTWVSWLMGWPLNWVETGGKSSQKSAEQLLEHLIELPSLKPLEMARFHYRQQSRGDCSEADDVKPTK